MSKENETHLFDEISNLEALSFDSTLIDPSNLAIYDKLDEGHFGQVFRGVYKNGAEQIPVAIKELKLECIQSRNEVQKEADLMGPLNHSNIIKFVGVCFEGKSSLKIVLEYAKLGALNKYVKTHKSEIPMTKLITYCHQIAMAMEYLASKSIVHRDLAARNVLLVNEDTCKVTDFGMSRCMNNDYYYYQTNKQAALPLKWYPLELILTSSKRYDEKSDVWSFGVTCWEVTSYGSIPYEHTDITNLVYLLQNGHRLEKPEECPQELYDIMFKCWLFNKSSRPTFSELVSALQRLIYKPCIDNDDDVTVKDFSPLVEKNGLFHNVNEDKVLGNYFNFHFTLKNLKTKRYHMKTNY